jgi:hypothetical protein
LENYAETSYKENCDWKKEIFGLTLILAGYDKTVSKEWKETGFNRRS